MSDDSAPEVTRLSKKAYEKELKRLQVELVNLQRWVLTSGARVVIVFEGRDAAGKGGAIKRIMQYLNPRSARVVALPTPNERERGQWYFQRYVERLPTKGEIVLFDRSWYNRAGVEHVLGYCTPDEYELFLRQVPTFERMLVDDGIILLKYWFSVSDDEQQRRFKSRLKDPMRRWKLSDTDLESIRKWEAYSRAKDDMFRVTDLPEAPWWTVESDHKKSARINVIRHLLTQIPFKKIPHKKVALPERPSADGYDRPGRELYKHVPDHAAGLVEPKPKKAAG